MKNKKESKKNDAFLPHNAWSIVDGEIVYLNVPRYILERMTKFQEEYREEYRNTGMSVSVDGGE